MRKPVCRSTAQPVESLRVSTKLPLEPFGSRYRGVTALAGDLFTTECGDNKSLQTQTGQQFAVGKTGAEE